MQQELSSFKQRFTAEGEALEQRLASLETTCASPSSFSSGHNPDLYMPNDYFNLQDTPTSTEESFEHEAQPFKEKPFDEVQTTEEEAVEEEPLPFENTKETAIEETYAVIIEDEEEPVYEPQKESAEVVIDEPEAETTPSQKQASLWLESLWTLLGESILSPLKQLQKLIQAVYLHYHSQNKLPIFYMTIGGIAALLFGFGYLMQYVSDAYFEYSKWIAGFGFSAAATWWGSRLMGRYKIYDDFGSALLALGIA